jgi:hypothetical protein
MGQTILSYEIPLKVQLVIEPFEKKDLEFVGPINPHLVRSITSWFAQTMLPNGSKPKNSLKPHEKVVAGFMFEDIFIHALSAKRNSYRWRTSIYFPI